MNNRVKNKSKMSITSEQTVDKRLTDDDCGLVGHVFGGLLRSTIDEVGQRQRAGYQLPLLLEVEIVEAVAALRLLHPNRGLLLLLLLLLLRRLRSLVLVLLLLQLALLLILLLLGLRGLLRGHGASAL